MKMKNLRKYARGQDCMIRLPGCSCNSDETVLAHLRLPETGMGRKEVDILGAWSCMNCHDIVDGRNPIGMSREQISLAFYEAVFRTQKELAKNGVIKW